MVSNHDKGFNDANSKRDFAPQSEFVKRNSIVRQVWGDSDMVLLVFAGSAAEFALNRAVDWLFFTGNLPRDPLGRLFSTVRYAQQIVFADETTAQQTLKRINEAHGAVERARAQQIPEWAYRDVLYMLIDYTERAHALLHRELTADERGELYDVFRRVGEGLHITELPASYAAWRQDRKLHLERDLVYSAHTAKLFASYRQHLGVWRYDLLLRVQALLVPKRVRQLLRLEPDWLLSNMLWLYGVTERLALRSVVHRLLMPPAYLAQVEQLDDAEHLR